MPSKSKKQHNLMAAVANNPKFAKKVGIPQSVGKEYVKADEGRKFKEGGLMKKSSCGTKKMAMGGMTKAKKTMRNLDDEIYRIDTEKAMEKRKMNKMMGGGKVMYKAGGKVRGAGMAKKGVRPCKMV